MKMGSANDQHDPSEGPVTAPGTPALEYATPTSARRIATAWTATAVGVLALAPAAAWAAATAGVVDPSGVWFDARDHLQFFGIPFVGPLLGTIALAAARPSLADDSALHASFRVARATGGMALAAGVVGCVVACAFAWPLLILDVLLVAGLAHAYKRR